MGLFDLFKNKIDPYKLREKKDIQGLIDAIKHENAGIRATAARAMEGPAVGTDKRILRALYAAIDDPDENVRKDAAKSLLGNLFVLVAHSAFQAFRDHTANMPREEKGIHLRAFVEKLISECVEERALSLRDSEKISKALSVYFT